MFFFLMNLLVKLLKNNSINSPAGNADEGSPLIEANAVGSLAPKLTTPADV